LVEETRVAVPGENNRTTVNHW